MPQPAPGFQTLRTAAEIRRRSSGEAPRGGMQVRRPARRGALPAQAARWSEWTGRRACPAAELLLCRRRVPKSSDAAIGAVSRPEGVRRRGRDPGGGDAAWSVEEASDSARGAAWHRPANAGSLAAVVDRGVPDQPILAELAWSLHAGDRRHRVAARGARSTRCRRRRGVGDRAAALARADLDEAGARSERFVMGTDGPQRMPVPAARTTE